MSIQDVERQRQEVMDEMLAIRSMRRGSITEQKLPSKKGGKATRGPYFVFSRRQEGKTVSKRLRPGPDLELAHQEVAAHKHFVELCRRFEQLTERLGELERGDVTQEKKRRR